MQPLSCSNQADHTGGKGGPGIAPTVPEVVDCEPFHPITPTANNIATTGPESNTHGNVRGSPSTRRVDGAQNTATGTATMATTSGVAKPKRKAWKHRKPKKAVIAKEADLHSPRARRIRQASPGWISRMVKQRLQRMPRRSLLLPKQDLKQVD